MKRFAWQASSLNVIANGCHCQQLAPELVRVDSDFSATPFKAKISNAEQLRVHTMLVIGGRDMEAGAVSLRVHGKVIAEILQSIKERRA